MQVKTLNKILKVLPDLMKEYIPEDRMQEAIGYSHLNSRGTSQAILVIFAGIQIGQKMGEVFLWFSSDGEFLDKEFRAYTSDPS